MWLLDQPEPFLPVEGGPGIALDRVCARTDSGVYFGRGAGLVAWWIPRGVAVASCRAQARQFALDSDLIVGALLKPSGMLVVGRERVVPVEVLPPLRAETIALLGSVQSDELAQSYERNHVLAGRLGASGDWAPAYLSPELVDTEYGSLLDIADQLLKSWSSNGLTRYENFPYPDPAAWPFPKALSLHLEAQTLTYNWNTGGAGYVVAAGDQQIFALNRTGALPISYIPEGAPEEAGREARAAEDAGYDYFAGRDDAHLVRVVQYAALYQIFRAAHVLTPEAPALANMVPKSALNGLMFELIRDLAHSTPESRAKLAPRIVKQLRAVTSPDNQKDLDKVGEVVEKALGIYQESLNDLGFLGQWVLATRLAHPSSPEDLRAQEELKLILYPLGLVNGVPERFAREVEAKTDAKGWIHTPTIVISTNRGEKAKRVGGHNIDARAVRFRISDRVGPKLPEIATEGDAIVVTVHPDDAAKIGETARVVGRFERRPDLARAELDRIMAGEAGDPPRGRAAALGTPPPEKPPTHRGLAPGFDGMDGNRPRPWAWRPVSRRVIEAGRPPLGELLRDNPEALIVERHGPEHFGLRQGAEGRVVEVGTPDDAVNASVDLLADAGRGGGKRRPVVYLLGYEGADVEAEGFIRSHRMQVEAAGLGGEGLPAGEDAGPLFVRVGKGQTPGKISAALEANYDFSKKGVSISRAVTRAGRERVTFKVEAPGVEPDSGRVKVELNLDFPGGKPPGAIARLINRVAAIFSEFYRGIISAQDLRSRVEKALNALKKEDPAFRDIEIRFRANSRDVIIIRKGTPHATADRQAA